MEELISKGFLYTLWNGRFNVKEGRVVRNQWCSRREAKFRYGDRDGEWIKCSPQSGIVVQAHLWLPEQDDVLARKILIDYYKGCINRVEKQIDGYRENIKILQNA